MPTLSTAPLDEREAELHVTEDFVGLLCADEAWVDAEFEAIIAAEWPSPPTEPSEPRKPAHDRPPSRGPRPVGDGSDVPTGDRPTRSGTWAQERSPPPRPARAP